MSVINISGLLIHSLPAHRAAVLDYLNNEDGIEVHKVMPDGRMVITVEKQTREETGYLLNELQTHEHILSAAVVYQHYEEDDANEEMSS